MKISGKIIKIYIEKYVNNILIIASVIFLENCDYKRKNNMSCFCHKPQKSQSSPNPDNSQQEKEQSSPNLDNSQQKKMKSSLFGKPLSLGKLSLSLTELLVSGYSRKSKIPYVLSCVITNYANPSYTQEIYIGERDLQEIVFGKKGDRFLISMKTGKYGPYGHEIKCYQRKEYDFIPTHSKAIYDIPAFDLQKRQTGSCFL